MAVNRSAVAVDKTRLAVTDDWWQLTKLLWQLTNLLWQLQMTGGSWQSSYISRQMVHGSWQSSYGCWRIPIPTTNVYSTSVEKCCTAVDSYHIAVDNAGWVVASSQIVITKLYFRQYLQYMLQISLLSLGMWYTQGKWGFECIVLFLR